MKTSNKLLLTATVIIFTYLAVYDFQLKAEYVKGDYRSRFYNMKHTALNRFTSIENNAGNKLGVNIEKGPKFEIWINDFLADKVVVTQRNNTLYIDFKDKQFSFYQAGITIICPAVDSIIASTQVSPDWQFSSGKTTVTGFTQDVMNIRANKLTEIELSKNSLGKLIASTGGSNATLTIRSDNQIKAADINIIGKSDLKLFNTIANSSYNCTDSATITLNGKLFRSLQTLK